jgi:hemerythrin-like domain-containing protein
MKATDLLEKQHRKVEAIFRKLEGGRVEPEPLLIELANNLAAHMAIEQEIFYPAVAKVDEDMVSEAYEEHSLAEVAIKRLLETDTEHEAFKARVIAAKELIQHHVEEEEQELFKKVRKALKDEQLEQLGKAMKSRFDEVYAAGFENAVPKTFKKTSADMTRGRMHASGKMRVAEHRNGSGRRRAA